VSIRGCLVRRLNEAGKNRPKKETLMTTTAIAAIPATSESISHGRFSRYVPGAARYLLGAVFFVCGLNRFLNFLPAPTGPVSEGAMLFAGALFKTGYMFPLIKGTEVLCATLLLTNRFVPLALALLAPVTINIVAFHAFLAPSGLGLAVFLMLLQIRLAWAHRSVYAPMLTPRAKAQ
jgi:hypothetical protein